MSTPGTTWEPIRGAAEVRVYTPGYWGQPNKLAWGMDHEFPRLEDDAPKYDPDAPSPVMYRDWTLSRLEYVPWLRAYVVKSFPEYLDLWPNGCANEAELLTALDPSARASAKSLYHNSGVVYFNSTAGSWQPFSPSGTVTEGYRQLYLHAVALDGGEAVATSTTNFPAEAFLTFVVYSWASDQELTTYRPRVEITWGYDGSEGGFKIVLPVDSPTEDAEDAVPSITSMELGASIEIASHKSQNDSRWPGAKYSVYSCRPGMLPGFYGLEGPSMPEGMWLYYEGLRVKSAPVTFRAVGCNAAFGIIHNSYLRPGETTATASATKAVQSWDYSWINATGPGTHQLLARGITHNDQGVGVIATDDNHGNSVTNITTALGLIPGIDNGETTPAFTLTTTDGQLTPVLFLGHELHPARRDPCPQEPPSDIEDAIARIVISETIDNRDAQCEFVIDQANIPSDFTDTDFFPPDGRYKIQHEAWLRVRNVRQQWSGPSSSLTEAEEIALGEADMFGGFVNIGESARIGMTDEGLASWRFVAHTWPWLFRGNRKPNAMHGGVSWQGVPFKTAVDYLLDSHDVPITAIDWTPVHNYDSGLLAVLCLPNSRPWERRLRYSQSQDVISILDELCLSVGIRWRINRLGLWEFYVPLMPDLTRPDHTLDADSSSTLVDMIESIRFAPEHDEFRNLILHVGQDEYGRQKLGLQYDYDRLFGAHPYRTYTPSWSVVEGNQNLIPETTSWAEFLRKAMRSDIVQWEWQGHPTWAPGETVQIDCDNIGLPAGTLLYLLEKQSTIDAVANDFRETVTASVIKWPA